MLFFSGKVPYISGALTHLLPPEQDKIKEFYCRIADLCLEVLGTRAYVPHEHSDPVKNKDMTDVDVDWLDRRQVMERTSILIIVWIRPSDGQGIEVEMANNAGIPAFLLCPLDEKISRLLTGNPAIQRGRIIKYWSRQAALAQFREALYEFVSRRDRQLALAL